jgi:hypothetical protein
VEAKYLALVLRVRLGGWRCTPSSSSGGEEEAEAGKEIRLRKRSCSAVAVDVAWKGAGEQKETEDSGWMVHIRADRPFRLCWQARVSELALIGQYVAQRVVVTTIPNRCLHCCSSFL